MPPEPLKVAYVAFWDAPTTGRGVTRKIERHLEAWNSQPGVEARLFLVTPNPDRAPPRSDRIDVIPLTRPTRRQDWREMAARVEAWGPDAIYWRFTAYQRVMGRLGSRYPIVVEINTDDLAEEARPFAPRAIFHRLKRPWIFRSSRGLVFVSGEFARRLHFTKYALPTAVIGNAVALERTPRLPVAPPSPIQVFYMGTPGQRWQGLDRLGELAALLPDWTFHVVGPRQDEMPAAPNVRMHGYLEPEKYLPIAQACHVAIGPLALFRKKLQETSALKVGECLAFGLPVILAGRDTDFPEGAPFLLELPNDDAPLSGHVDAIRAFAQEWAGRRVDRAAIAHLDVAVKEARRIGFIRRIVEDARGSGDRAAPPEDRGAPTNHAERMAS